VEAESGTVPPELLFQESPTSLRKGPPLKKLKFDDPAFSPRRMDIAKTVQWITL
jgi:hypothetical protein